MKNSEFCAKVTRMIGGSVELVEANRDYFKIKTTNIWLKSEQSVYLSSEFIEWVKVFAWRSFKVHVQWDDLNLAFWFKSKE